MKNLKIKQKAIAMALAGTLATATLTSCGANESYPMIEDKRFKLAVIFGTNTATIIEIDSYTFSTHDEILYLYLQDGSEIMATTNDTKIIKDKSYEEVEQLIEDIMGENVKINYYNYSNTNTLSKK